jgi:quercetin dioxygenase-like cupin family protein
MSNVQSIVENALSITHHPRSKRYYFGVAIGSVCVTGADTGGAYCLLEESLAPGISVPRHTHTREDEVYYVTSGELEVIVGNEIFVLKAGDSLVAPRYIPHELCNSGSTINQYMLLISPSGFEEFVMATALPAPDNAVAPIERHLQPDDHPSVAVRNVHELAADYGILFG